MDHLEAAASSMLPPPQREETVRYSQEEWNQHRPIIEGMYPLKGIRLKDIISFLKEDKGFVIK
jgi:Clr5 domain